MNQFMKVNAVTKIRSSCGEEIMKLNEFGFYFDESNIEKSKLKFLTAAQDSWDMIRSSYSELVDSDDLKKVSWKEEAFVLFGKDKRWFVKNSKMECLEQIRIPETWKDI